MTTMPYRICDAKTGSPIEGVPTAALVEASFAADPEGVAAGRGGGAVLACANIDNYADGDAPWTVIDEEYADAQRATGATVRSVYVCAAAAP